jgi:hypothetical protein
MTAFDSIMNITLYQIKPKKSLTINAPVAVVLNDEYSLSVQI